MSEQPQRSEQQECDHQWTDYGTLKSGDNPRLEIEACIRCGVQRKKQHSEQQGWAVSDYECLLKCDGITLGFEGKDLPKLHAIVDAHKAALAADREKLSNEEYISLEQGKVIKDLERQLAAERKNTESVRRFWRDTYETVKATLAAERQRHRDALKGWEKTVKQLLSAQAAIEAIRNNWSTHDLSNEKLAAILGSQKSDLMRQHEAEVRRPLMEALESIRNEAVALVDALKFPNSVLHIEAPKRIKQKANDALAKVKEDK